MTAPRHRPHPQHCFAYGTLMCADIMRRVAGPAGPAVPGVLRGYRRSPVTGEEYPGIVAESGAAVAGVVYLDLPAAAWARLDAFEGAEYRREAVGVELEGGRTLDAWAYVYRSDCRHRLSAGDWDFGRFLEHGKARFSARFVGFDKVGKQGPG